MRRRDLLTATAGALSVAAAGCTGLANSDDTDPETSEPTDTDEPTGTDDTADETGDHHLYVENLDDEDRRVSLTVTRESDGETVIDGTYEVSDERGAKFEDVADWGETYEVSGSLETGVSATYSWEIESCEGGEAPNGSRNGSLRIEPDATDLSFVTDICDGIRAGTEVPTGPADQFEVEPDRDPELPTEDPDTRHDLVLENHDDEDRRLAVTVECDGDVLVDGAYELPDGRGAVFDDVAGREERYEIDATLDTGESASFTWETPSCNGTEAPNGSRNGAVAIESPHADESLAFFQDQCDAIIVGADVATGPAEQFELEDGEFDPDGE